MPENKKKEEIAPSMNPDERPDLEDYKSKEKRSQSDTAKKANSTSAITVPTPKGDIQAETELEIPLEGNRENVKSEIKSKVKHYQKRSLHLPQLLKKSMQRDKLKYNTVVSQSQI